MSKTKGAAPGHIRKLSEVFGVNRHLPLNYVSREKVDEKLKDSLTRDHHIVIYGSSKQGKTCLRKNCLEDNQCIVISCSNKWSLGELHSHILKEAGFNTSLSSVKTITGQLKLNVTIAAEWGVPLVSKGSAGGNAEATGSYVNTDTRRELEIDPEDPNDIIRSLKAIQFKKFIILEDFHYLPDNTQKAFAFALKAFHEKSELCFIIVGVWREQNRLITLNGDLTERVYSVDVDTWTENSLREAITVGEKLLNILIDKQFKDELIANCHASIHIVQEVCRRCCKACGIHETQYSTAEIGKKIFAKELIKDVVNEQTSRNMSLLTGFADGFQKTKLEMPKWVIYALLSFPLGELEGGIRLTELSRRIKAAHPVGMTLNNGNIIQALKSAVNLQDRKQIRPIVLNYDNNNNRLHIVDKGFLVWLGNQDVAELLSKLDLPPLPKDFERQASLQLNDAA